MNHTATPLPDRCRHPGCPHPRVTYTIFCEIHHQQQLDRAQPRVQLRPKDMAQILIGPVWLNALRIAAGLAAGRTMNLPSAVACGSLVAVASALLGWRWARRLFPGPQPGFPIAFVPSPAFLVPLTAVAALVVNTAIGIARIVASSPR